MRRKGTQAAQAQSNKTQTGRLDSGPSLYILLGVALFCMIAAATGIANGLTRLAESSREVEQGYRVIAAAENILAVARDAETGQRGFILTGQEGFLDPYKSAQARIPAARQALLATSNPQRDQAVRTILRLFEARMAHNRKTMLVARTQGLAAARAIIDSGTGKAIMDELRLHVARFVGTERLALKALQRDNDRVFRESLAQATLGSLALIFAGGLLYAAFRQARSDAEARLRESEEGLRKLQDELAHIGRVNDLGEMATAIAHEMNQPLTAMANYFSAARHIVRNQPDVPDALPEILERGAEQAVRAGDIIKRMRTFVEPRDHVRTPEDVAALIDAAIALTNLSIDPHQIEIVHHNYVGRMLVTVDAVHIQQVLIILMRNAVEAFAAHSKREKLRIDVTTSFDAKDKSVSICVADNGPGLSPEITATLFQPFTTSKPGNLGVGLSIARRLVDHHGGTLSIVDRKSNEPWSTCFCVRLPQTGVA